MPLKEGAVSSLSVNNKQTKKVVLVSAKQHGISLREMKTTNYRKSNGR